MKKLLCLIALTFTGAAFAETINFYSERPWDAARWYLLARWINPTNIEWMGGKITELKTSPQCRLKPSGISKIYRPLDIETTLGKDEILTSRNWVLIEVSPSVESERFDVQLSSLTPDDPNCKSSIVLTYGWSGEKTNFRPLLFLKAHNNRFFGHQIDVLRLDEDDDESSDILLDLSMYYVKASFPNVLAGGSSGGAAPVVLVRGEWMLPFQKSLGLSLSLQQNIFSFNGIAGQSTRYSDWILSAFYQNLIPVSDGLLLRAGVGYLQHYADDSANIPTVASPNRDLKNFVGTLSLSQYFARHWMLAGSMEIGLSGDLSGRGANQSYEEFFGRVGYRLTPSLTGMLQGGLQIYSTEGFRSEINLLFGAGAQLAL